MSEIEKVPQELLSRTDVMATEGFAAARHYAMVSGATQFLASLAALCVVFALAKLCLTLFRDKSGDEFERSERVLFSVGGLCVCAVMAIFIFSFVAEGAAWMLSPSWYAFKQILEAI